MSKIPRGRRTPPPPPLTGEAKELMDAVTRLIVAGHIPQGGLKAFIEGKSPADILAEADRLCGPAPLPKRRAAARRPAAKAPSGSFDIEVSVRDIEPRIWRRFTIKSSETFLDLHEAIQDAGGWTNSHLFAFRDPDTGAPIAGLPSDDDGCDSGPFAGDVRLDQVFPATGSTTILYEYDFGDGWRVDVVCHAHIPEAAPWQRKLTGGARAFPMDDCGGIPGYEECVEAASAEKPTAEQKERLDWLGGWVPEEFELAEEAKGFDRMKRKRTGHYSEEM